ncbi:hypothetical protein H5T87_01600 [bacterium]|nr:hypothetical protein [bacterium]
MKFARLFYKMARIMNDFETLSSGNPSRIARRGLNKLIGRTIGRNIYLKGTGGRRRKRMF